MFFPIHIDCYVLNNTEILYRYIHWNWIHFFFFFKGGIGILLFNNIVKSISLSDAWTIYYILYHYVGVSITVLQYLDFVVEDSLALMTYCAFARMRKFRVFNTSLELFYNFHNSSTGLYIQIFSDNFYKSKLYILWFRFVSHMILYIMFLYSKNSK